jgi:hypothetical protein
LTLIGKSVKEVEERLVDYIESDCVSLHTGTDPNLNTLEPQIVDANELRTLNTVLGGEYSSKEEVLEAMRADKTGAALAIFESETSIVMREYVRNVVAV